MIRLCALVLAPRSSVVLVPVRCRRTVTAAPCFRHSATSRLFAQGNVSTWTLSPQSKIQPFFTAEEKKKWGRGRGNQLFPHRSMCSNVQLFHKCVVVAAKPIKLLFSPRITVARGLNEVFLNVWSQLTLNPWTAGVAGRIFFSFCQWVKGCWLRSVCRCYVIPRLITRRDPH